MTPEAIEKAAETLVRARVEKRVIAGLPEGCRPRTIADAYAVQDRMAAMLGRAVGGWFCGATNPEIRNKLNLPSPYCARLFADAVRESPAELSARDFPVLVLECEIAFRIARDLPPRAAPYGEDEVAAAVASVHPAIEIVTSHFQGWPRGSPLDHVADNGTDGVLVCGPGVRPWPGLELPRLALRLAVNGTVVREGKGANVMGDPLSALAWLANDCAKRGEGLRAGSLNNTGSCTAMYEAKAGDEAVLSVDRLGEARVTIRDRGGQ